MPYGPGAAVVPGDGDAVASTKYIAQLQQQEQLMRMCVRASYYR
jgi:hypothetical protein